ncbi:LPXTG cell wall anchor domain-containing protein [Actinoplanes philippinensis]|uniref:LPXTG cell wall anchor domain-containing protein n=1 Tax=Actinoplanes philippinensis TaxID=35752 RepID=UPI0033E45B86
MNVSKSPLRRVSALAAGSLIGLAGVAVFATPAFAHHSTVAGKTECVEGNWVVEWTVNAIGDGRSPNQTATFTTVDLLPAKTSLDNAKLVVNGAPVPAGVPITAKQIVPGDAKEASLSLVAKWDNPSYFDGKVATGKVSFAEECKKTPSEEPSTPTDEPSTPTDEPSTPADEPSTPAENPSAPTENPSAPPLEIPEEVPAEPILEETCDTISVGVDNTKNTTPFTIQYETSKGEKRTLVVKPGEAKSEKFSATEGFSVKVTYTVEWKGVTYTSTAEVPWQKPAEGCDDDGQGGGLPVTGAAAGGVAAGAAGLLAIGGALFFVARRRKVKFTA